MGKTNQLGVLADVFTSDASNNVGIGGSPSGSYKLEVTGTAKVSSRINGVVGGTLYNTAGLWLQGSSATDGIAIGGTAGGDKNIDTYGGTLKINATSANGLSITGGTTFNSGDLFVNGTNAVIAWQQSGVTRGYTGIITNAGAYIPGSITNDIINRSNGYNFLWSVDSGSNCAMKLTSGGNLVINGTTAAYPSTNRGNLTLTGTSSSLLGFHNGTTQTGYIYNDYAASVFQWVSSGNNIQIVNTSNGVQLTAGATSWSSISDERLKNITGNIENAVESLMTLRTIKHTWKLDESNKENFGLIAQDVQKVFPQVIDINKLPSKLDDEYKDDTEYLAVRYTELVPVLIKAIQEMNTKIIQLEKIVATK